jgi:hypothetical protein
MPLLRRRISEFRAAEDRAQVLEAVEDVPDAGGRAVLPVRVQVSQRGIGPVALERGPGLPLDEEARYSSRSATSNRFSANTGPPAALLPVSFTMP